MSDQYSPKFMREMIPPEPILVTGASGFLGEHLVRGLVSIGAQVIGTTLSKSLTIDNARLISVDLTDRDATTKLIADIRPQSVIHTAALTDVAACQRDPARARASIVEATQNLVAALKQSSPAAHLVYVSTDLVYDGKHTGSEKRYVEEDEARPLSVYGQCKLEAERIAAAFEASAIVRPSLIYGPPTTHRAGFLGWLIGALKRGEKVNLFSDEVRSPTAVGMLVDALKALSIARSTGLWLAGGEDTLDRWSMGKIIAEVYGISLDQLIPTKLCDSTYPAPRPSELGLDSKKLWKALGLSGLKSFKEEIEDLYSRGAFRG